MISLFEKPLSPPVARHFPRLRVWWLPAIGLLLLGGYALASRAFPKARPAGIAPGQLRLLVESSRQGLLLSWQRCPEESWRADRGVLSIIDGSQAEHVELEPDYIRAGRLRYRPLSSDVAFRLELAGSAQGRTASGWIRSHNRVWPPEPDPGTVEVRTVSFELVPPAPPATDAGPAPSPVVQAAAAPAQP